MSFRNSLTRHLTPVGNAHIRSELVGGGARSWRLPVVVVVVVDGVPQLTNTPPHYYRSPLSSFEAWSELFSHHPPPFVPGTGGGAGEGAEGGLAMGTDKQTDLDPSCVTHTMKDQRQTDEAADGLFPCTLARGTSSSRRSDKQKWWRRAGGLESLAAAIKSPRLPAKGNCPDRYQVAHVWGDRGRGAY